MPLLTVAKLSEGEVITEAVKSSELLLKKLESPDVTRPAKKLENSLGAISKVRQLRSEAVASPTASTASSSNSSLSPK